MTSLAQLADRLRSARSVTVLTGAGVSAASGVPTFRGTGGLWRTFSATELASPDAFARDPDTVWEWYAWRREQIAQCEPNAAHQVLARWTQARERWRVVTQNVDDLHVRAGTRDLVRLHGSIFELRCCVGCAASRARRGATIACRSPRCRRGVLTAVGSRVLASSGLASRSNLTTVRACGSAHRLRRVSGGGHVGGRLSGRRVPARARERTARSPRN